MVNIDTGEEMPIAIDTEWVPEKYIPLNFYTYSLSGNYRFRCVYETLTDTGTHSDIFGW